MLNSKENRQNIEIISEIKSIRAKIHDWKRQNLTVGFVPTMGALHIGHASLIEKAKSLCDRVVVSIFVNPAQFGPNEDYSHYPRQIEKDREICLNNQANVIFTPTVQEMYPDNADLTAISVPDSLKNKLCGIARQGHFDGVATVVVKLLNIIQPDKAFFGQKDAQQLIIIKKICRDLNLSPEIIGCPIIRDHDGLACSSRNTYLSLKSRNKALSLFKTLKKVEELYKSGLKLKNEVLIQTKEYLHPDISLEYFDIYNIDTLEPEDILRAGLLVAIAANVDGVRLIDNIVLK